MCAIKIVVIWLSRSVANDCNGIDSFCTQLTALAIITEYVRRNENDEFQGAYSSFIFYSLSVDVYARRLSCHDQGHRR